MSAQKPDEVVQKAETAKIDPGLYGDAAQETWAQAMSATDPADRHRLMAQAEAQSTARRRELMASAEGEPFGCYTRWIAHMPVRIRAKVILARIYSFQVSGGDCRMSIGNLGDDVGVSRGMTKTILLELEKAGFLCKISRGERTPASYTLDVPRCIEAARANGWEPRHRQAAAPKQNDKQSQP